MIRTIPDSLTRYDGEWSGPNCDRSYIITCHSETEYIRACKDAGALNREIHPHWTSIDGWIIIFASYHGGQYGATSSSTDPPEAAN